MRRRSTAQPVSPADQVGGLVEESAWDRLFGWVVVPAGAPPTRVSVRLNELEIAVAWAGEANELDSWGEIRPFRFRLRDVWDFVGTEDEVTVSVEGRPLPMSNRGMSYRPRRAGTRHPADLATKLAEGYVFGQTGRLQLSKKVDVQWQREVLSVFERTRALLAQWYGYELFFMYGSLLGIVREGGFIGHDLDFDAAYISKHTDGPSAVAELRDIALALIDAGFEVASFRTHLHVTDDAGVRIDVFHLYFDTSGTLCFPFGIAGTGQITSAQWRGTKEIDFSGGKAVVPVLAEPLVEVLYGADWRQPKPGFAWRRDKLDRSPEGIMGDDMIEEIHWADFYRRSGPLPGSPFAAAVLARADTPSAVVDIGCGDGRDALAFAAAGRSVVGLDRSEVAVQHALARAEGADLRFAICDIADAAAVRSALGDALPAEGPVLFYLRFLLHAVTEDAQATLMDVISQVARPGDQFAAEFRTDLDEALPKALGKRERRFQNGPAFGVALQQRYGFEVLDERAGTGLAPYQDEDPEIYRVIARRSG